MSYDILILLPTSYTKKSKKPCDFTDVDQFIKVLEKKFSEWKMKCFFEAKVGVAHKLKFDQLENNFFTKSSLILYIVGSSSAESFRNSIKKIVDSCQKKEKLKTVIVVSLEQENFMEINESEINLIYVGGSEWKSEEDSQWKIMENILLLKLENVINSQKPLQSIGTSLTLPLPISRKKSPSKIKSFFNSLPSKFDIEKRRSFKDKIKADNYNESVPNIKISKFPGENKDKKSKQKEDSTRLSLNSIFRKGKPKTRDSGLSIGSSNSNGSDSKNSETVGIDKNKLVHEDFDSTSETPPSCERSPILYTSNLEKTKSYKAKIHMFKNRANKVFNSANCLQSPDKKRRKNKDDSFSDEDQFSDHQIKRFTDTFVNDLDSEEGPSILNTLYNQRGHSEPPIIYSEPVKELKKIDHTPQSLDLITNQESIPEKSTDNNVASAAPQPAILEINTCENNDFTLEENINERKDFNEFIEEDIIMPLDKTEENNIDEINTENIDQKYFQVDYAQNPENSPIKTGKHSVTFKVEGLDSLENIMESIQKSCDEMKIKSKENRDQKVVLNTFKGKTEQEITDKERIFNTIDVAFEEMMKTIDHEVKSINEGQLENTKIVTEIDECKVSLGALETSRVPPLIIKSEQKSRQAPQTPKRTESSSNTQSSILYKTTNYLMKNPLVVTSLFTATAFTAPTWSAYIPHDIGFDHILSFAIFTMNRILRSEMIQSFSLQFLPIASIKANAATRILQRNLVMPTKHTNIFFQNYKLI